MKHDLILLGKGPSMNDCPFDTEVWAALSVCGLKGWEDKPYSKLFCFDQPDRKPDEMAGLKVAQARDIPIVSIRTWPFVTEYFPRAEIHEWLGMDYYLNDMSYMIALALYKEYKSLLLWGVDQGPKEETIYRMARKYVTFWLGVADGLGVHWELAPNSILWVKDD